MRPNALLLLLLSLVLCWTSCGNDDDATVTETLNYDGPNVTAPQLPPGTNQFAAYFPGSETARFGGRNLERVSFYLSQLPEGVRVVVYDEGPDNRTPGAELYRSSELINRASTGWNEHLLLSTPVELTGDGLWLAIEVDLAQGSPISVGCDAGRNYNANGDLLLLSINTQYASFGQINPGETVNWNIRGVIGED